MLRQGMGGLYCAGPQASSTMRVLPLSTNLSQLHLDHDVFVYPTDTCYGIGCSVFDEEALKRVYKAKGRDFAKPVNIMMDSVEMMEEYGELSPTARKLAETFLPGDFTLLLPRKDTLPSFINPCESLVGLRIPDHTFCLALVKALRAPVVTTSANVAGQRETYSLPNILEAFGEDNTNIDLVFDGGVLEQNPPSTIVKVIGDSWEIVRQGRITPTMITSTLR